MMSSSGFFSQTEHLIEAPSVELWEQEINRVLQGTREHAVIQIGGAQAYVGALLTRTSDAFDGEAMFRRALDNMVGRWQPRAPTHAHTLAHMLALIAGYAPAGGFDRVLGHLTASGRFDETVIGELKELEYGDLHLKALITLARYLSAPPISSDRIPAFQAYVQVLSDHLYREPYAGYAARRLYELDALDFTLDFLDGLLNRTHSVITPLVQAILAPVRLRGRSVNETRVRSHISALYRSCGRMRGAGAVHEFRRALHRLDGFSLEPQGDGDCVRFRGYDEELILTLELSDESAQREMDLARTWTQSKLELEEQYAEAMRANRAASTSSRRDGE